VTSLSHLSETAKHWGDAGAVGGAVAALFGWLPEVTALLVAIWTVMRLYECWLNIKLKRRELGE
jgi:hypothetical protein